MEAINLAKYLDFANHRPDATEENIEKLCQKVIEHGFNSVFVNPYYVPLAKSFMAGRSLVGTVISFPLGQESHEVKMVSSLWAVKNGADELDQAINNSLIKEGKYDFLLKELKEIVLAVKTIKKETIVKFILEVGCLTDEEIKRTAEMILLSGADFIKIGSGMGPRGPNLNDVSLVQSVVGDKIRIKVAGGITNYTQAIAFISAGVSRIGTSHAVEIVKEKDEALA